MIGKTGKQLRERLLIAARDFVSSVPVPTEEQCRAWVLSETHDKSSGYGGYWCVAPVEEAAQHQYPAKCRSAVFVAISRNWRPKYSELRRVCDIIAGLSQ